MRRAHLLPTAVLVTIGGVIHLQLWLGGYRGIPFIGPWFLANVVASAVIAAAIVATADRRVTLAGLVLSAASLTALVLSRTVGLAGFLETTWTDQALAATGAELGAVVASALALVVTSRSPASPVLLLVRPDDRAPRRRAA